MHGVFISPGLEIQYLAQCGALLPISSPFTSAEAPLRADCCLAQDFLYYGASVLDNGCIELHFIQLSRGHHSHRSWFVDSQGKYLHERDSSPSLADRVAITHVLDHFTNLDVFAAVARRFLNDLQIYFLLEYVFGLRSQGQAYLDTLASSLEALHVPHVSQDASIVEDRRNVHLLIVYNHCYARNISRLDLLYRKRFATVFHALPNVAPRHSRCCAVPFGSYQYHLAVVRGLEFVHQHVGDQDWILVIQDDVLLHPSVRAESLLSSMLTDSCCSSFYRKLRIGYNSLDSWAWNQRITNSCSHQADREKGNGFEGPPMLLDESRLSRGVADVFALHADCISPFNDILGCFASANVFPEVAIPTALRLLRDHTGRDISLFPGLYLWGEKRRQIQSDQWIKEDFVDSSLLFLHPVKLSRAEKIIAYS